MKHKGVFCKLLKVAVCAAMALSTFGATAFAGEGEGEGGTSGGATATATPTYELYQVFTGVVGDDNSLANIKWGQNAVSSYTNASGETISVTSGALVAGGSTDSASNEALTDLSAVAKGKTSDAAKLEVIKKYVNLDSTPYRSNVDTAGSYEYKNVDPGYYVIKQVNAADSGKTYSLALAATASGTLTFEPKTDDVPTVTKTVGADKATSNSASIGDTVSFTVCGSVAAGIDAYAAYYYKFADTLSAGLTLDPDSVDIKIGATSVKDKFTIVAGENSLTAEIANLKGIDGITISSKTTVVLTYSATLNEKAVIGSSANTNQATITYSNDPNGTSTGTSGPSETKTYTTALTVTKTDNESNALDGASFTLKRGDVVVKEKAATTKDDDGNYTATFTGLGAGTYTLEESVTPNGYNTMDPITFTIGFRAVDEKFYVEGTDASYISVSEGNTLSTTVINYPGTILPSTGGVGTTMFYVVGAILVIGALTLLVVRVRTRRRGQ